MTLINVLFAEARRLISAASRIGTIVNLASGLPMSSGSLCEMTDAADVVRLSEGGASILVRA